MIEYKDSRIGLFKFSPEEGSLGAGAETNSWGVVSIDECKTPVIDPLTGKELQLCIKFTQKVRTRAVMNLPPMEGVCAILSTGRFKHQGNILRYTIMKRYSPIHKDFIATATTKDIINFIGDVLRGLNSLREFGYTHSDLHVNNIMYDEDLGRYVIIDIDSLTSYTPLLNHITSLHFIKRILTIRGTWRSYRALFIHRDFLEHMITPDEIPSDEYRRCYESQDIFIRKFFGRETMNALLNDHRHEDTPEVIEYRLKLSKLSFEELPDVDRLREDSPAGFYLPGGATKYTLLRKLTGGQTK
jgi:hypothetical protein